MTETHAERSHATWSASATARNWQCLGAIAMGSLAGEEVESIHAAKGTAAHTLAERVIAETLKFGPRPCANYLGEFVVTKTHKICVDMELAASAQTYVDYVLHQFALAKNNPPASLELEKNYSLSVLNPPFDAGGTCDAIIISPGARTIEIADLKNGMGLVEVNENKQTRTYALAAFLNLPKDITDQIDTIKVTIVQPRAPHKDGRIRSEVFHVADLIDWTGELMKRMHLAFEARQEFDKLNGNRVLFDEWSDRWLTPGNCTFCPAEGFCPALKKQALSIAPKPMREWHEDTSLVTMPFIPNQIEFNSPEELGHMLDGFSMLEDWIKAVRSHAHRKAENGMHIPGWQLAEREGNRAWLEKNQIVLANRIRSAVGVSDDVIYERSVRSIAQLEKLLNVEEKEKLTALKDTLWSRPITGTNLVSTAKTQRLPAKSKPATFHEEIGE